ncbi:MAG TPA: hypothetical protein PLE12_11605 [Propionicimonas sp.]|jgi:hypothetical protein|nr:hypothetical protein [Propionicimonas sp.]
MPTVTTKSKCCRKDERCKRCPVLLLRLEKDGWAECCERHAKAKATYKVSKKVPRKVVRAARKR